MLLVDVERHGECGLVGGHLDAAAGLGKEADSLVAVLALLDRDEGVERLEILDEDRGAARHQIAPGGLRQHDIARLRRSGWAFTRIARAEFHPPDRRAPLRMR